VFLVFFTLFSPDIGHAVSGDEHWDPAFGWPGTSNRVFAIAWHNGKFYTGGLPFGGLPTVSCLNVWDGAQWSTIGRFSSSTPYINDLAFVGDVLYAGGSFTNVDGVEARGMAKWDGTSWSSVGDFKGGVPFQFAVDGNNLYVGGLFTNAIGSVVMTNIGYWDGSAWHALGDGLGSGKFGSSVSAIVVTNGLVYAGGTFTNSGSSPVTNLATWNGSTWSQLAPVINGSVSTFALSGPDIYVGGTFTSAGTTSAKNIAKWNGASWSALGTGLNVSPSRFAFLSNQLCVVGSFTNAGGISAARFAKWNGASWSAAGAGLSSDVYTVISTGTNLYVGGDFLLAGGQIASCVAFGDGNGWGTLGTAGRTNGLSTAVRAIVSDGSNVYVGGSFLNAGNIQAIRVARWDGTNWHALGSGCNNTVTALALKGNDLFAAGTFTNAGGITATRIARWDGTNWYALGGGGPTNINTLAVYGNDLLIGGNFKFNVTDGTANCLARWDGTNWWIFGGYSLTVPANGNGVNALAVQGNDVYVGGGFRAASYLGPTYTNIVRYDTFDWVPMGAGVNSNVNALAIIDDKLYAAGQFTKAGGLSVNRIAMWDGTDWFNVGGGVTGVGNVSITDLQAVGGNLYAIGTFTNAGGIDVNRIAKWDGANWSALGGGITPAPLVSAISVIALGAQDSDLYVGGIFGQAGNKGSFYLARWNETNNFDFLPAIQLSNALATPSGPFKFTITASGIPSYVIEATTNFAAWTPLETNSLGSYDFYDSNAPVFPSRFYRVHSGP
jgi:hypothetical protein